MRHPESEPQKWGGLHPERGIAKTGCKQDVAILWNDYILPQIRIVYNIKSAYKVDKMNLRKIHAAYSLP